MNDFEHQLKRALNPIEPPPGFTERLLARLAQEAAAAPPYRPHAPRPWLAAAAALVLLAGSGALYQHHAREIKGEAAKQKLLVALHIASSKLQHAQEHVQQVENSELN